jgi:hypothetical protein
VIDVFGDECPVCSHSVDREHNGPRCTVCGLTCREHPWPPASVQRFTAAQRGPLDVAEVLKEHECCYEWGGPDWYCGADGCRGAGNSWDEYAEHVAQVWAAS